MQKTKNKKQQHSHGRIVAGFTEESLGSIAIFDIFNVIYLAMFILFIFIHLVFDLDTNFYCDDVPLFTSQ